MSNTATQAKRFLAVVAVVVGGAGFVLCVIVRFYPDVAGQPPPRVWHGESLYLTSSWSDQHCAVFSADGRFYTVAVPRMSSRDSKLRGTLLDSHSGDNAVLECTRRVRATQGPLLRLYPLAENDPWVVLPSIVAMAMGWVSLTHRHGRGRPGHR